MICESTKRKVGSRNFTYITPQQQVMVCGSFKFTYALTAEVQ